MAEHTRVSTVPVTDLQAGMKVHADILGYKGKTLVASGEVLTQKHIQKLKQWEAREKPQGPALPKKDPKDRVERTRFGEWQGGYRPSHFNQGGIPVTTAFGTPDEVPAIEKDPERSKLIQNQGRKSFAVGGEGIESPFFRHRELETEIKNLLETNASLGGSLTIKSLIPESKEFMSGGEEQMQGARDAIKVENEKLIVALKAPKREPAPTKGGPSKTRGR